MLDNNQFLNAHAAIYIVLTIKLIGTILTIGNLNINIKVHYQT